MTPKEKAQELLGKFLRTYKVSLFPPFNKASEEAKQCALIAVDEVTKILESVEANTNYWQQVHTEIENL